MANFIDDLINLSNPNLPIYLNINIVTDRYTIKKFSDATFEIMVKIAFYQESRDYKLEVKSYPLL